MEKLYPLKLSCVLKSPIWSGEKLKNGWGKHSDSPIGESWELSVRKNENSVVENGALSGRTLASIIDEYGPRITAGAFTSKDFPLLVKLIDAGDDLSVQVHPNDDYAARVEADRGKTEMWYVLDCDEGAALYYGFTRDVTREEYEDAIKEGRLTDILNRVNVQRGDVFFIPAGTVHAIGAGILICEIQQNSNTTYRVYDYNRRDKDGNLRPLHVAKALEVSSLQKSPDLPATPDGADVLLAECEYFEVRRLRVCGECTISADETSFISLMATDGQGTLSYEGGSIPFTKGDSLFIPAQTASFTVSGECELIQSKVN